MQNQNTIPHLAAKYLGAGFSVIPIRADGSKRPTIPWKEHQARRMAPDEVQTHFAGNVGLGVVCGRVSGGLEVIDIEGPNKGVSLDETRAIEQALEAAEPELWAKLYRVRAPGGGLHLYFRSEAVEPGQPLARKLVDGKPQILIETRGEGHYVLAVGSPASCHPSGKRYMLEHGTPATVPTITPEQRARLLEAARAFNEAPEPERRPEPTPQPRTPHPGEHDGEGNAGDWYNAHTAWADILQPHGWTFLRKSGAQEEWVRPDKKERTLSAATNRDGTDRLYVFSLNAAPLEAGRYYDKFGAFARLNHGGDMKAAARAVWDRIPAADRARAERPQERLNGHAAAYQSPEPQERATAHESGGNWQAKRDDDAPEFNLTDVGNARRLVYDHGENIRYVYAWDKWLVWDGKRWKRDDSREIYRLAEETVRGMYAAASRLSDSKDRAALAKHAMACEKRDRLLAMIDWARNAEAVGITVDKLDADLYALNVQNGTIDLRTGELRPHRREDLFTKLAPVAYDAAAKAPKFQAFLRRFLKNDPGLIDYVQRLAGYSITGDVGEHVFPIMYGTGANGKGTFVSCISEALGPDYAMAAAADTLMSKPKGHGAGDDLARLVGARFVSASETSDGGRLAEARVKSITGGDKITARHLFQNYFEFMPQFKVWLSTNHRPEIRGMDNGIWRRVKLIPFDVVIPDEEKIQNYFERELRPELPGILNWLVDGCVRWQKHGLKDEPEAVAAATREYKSDSDAIARWIEERCITGEGFGAKASALYSDFRAWSLDGGEQPISANAFGRRLLEAGFQNRRSNGKRYDGIGLRGGDGGAD